MKTKTPVLTGTAALSLLLVSGCTASGQSADAEVVSITGSATIEPIATIASRESGVDTSIEAVGSYEGFEQFCSGDADINNASAPIPGADAPEDVPDYQQMCEDNGVEYVEIPIGMDAVAIVTNTENEAVENITRDELAEIWNAESPAETWSDVRDEWPDEPIVLHGRDEGSGTHAVFTEEILGDTGDLTDNAEETDDLDLLANRVAEDPAALSFMGIGNYLSAPEEDRNRITTVPVDGVEPDMTTSVGGDYPLARELYVYVAVDALDEQPQVEEYLNHLLDNGSEILPRAYFYPLDQDSYDDAAARLDDRETGPSQ